MGTGYVRNDTANNISPGSSAQAEDLDGEFDALVSTFNATTGHSHDGTPAEGGPVTFLGPTQDVESTATAFRPTTDGEVDLGDGTHQFGAAFIDGDISVTGTVDGRDVSVDGAALDQAETDITALDNRVTQNESDIDDIESAASTLTDRVDDAEADIDALETLTSGHTSDIASNTSAISSNDTDISNLQTQSNNMVQTVISALYPVGSLYMSSNSTMPSAMTTGRTWVAYAEGRAIVGVGTADGVAYSGGTTRGSNEVELSTSQLPTHNHGNGSLAVSGNTGSGGSWNFDVRRSFSDERTIFSGSSTSDSDSNSDANALEVTGSSRDRQTISHPGHNHSFSANVSGSTSNAGSGSAHTNIQPSIGVYVWRRTA